MRLKTRVLAQVRFTLFLCRLLQLSDRAASDTVALTKELLADMLGVRRTSATDVARKMQAKGVITYTRGVIAIMDRAALARFSCECYQNAASLHAAGAGKSIGYWRSYCRHRLSGPRQPDVQGRGCFKLSELFEQSVLLRGYVVQIGFGTITRVAVLAGKIKIAQHPLRRIIPVALNQGMPASRACGRPHA